MIRDAKFGIGNQISVKNVHIVGICKRIPHVPKFQIYVINFKMADVPVVTQAINLSMGNAKLFKMIFVRSRTIIKAALNAIRDIK